MLALKSGIKFLAEGLFDLKRGNSVHCIPTRECVAGPNVLDGSGYLGQIRRFWLASDILVESGYFGGLWIFRMDTDILVDLGYFGGFGIFWTDPDI